ncbi:hypothetical protein JIQ42_07365 [Leishmania sp. Namibia]|uniref:hypothetical protein n=1 Tax=Leishmania sp. Namibia TaxID=2802991 RepID=UPI001B7C96B5|nr:hypothetical protein JIQ42_07365 [Leishmania sp. Namibia]
MSATSSSAAVPGPSESAANASPSSSLPTPRSDVSAAGGAAASSFAAANASGVCPEGEPRRRKLPRVSRTPELIVKVRDCPTSRMPIDICYQCFGNPADGLPTVLLIGGLNMQLSAWDETFCESLVRAGFYVIRYDNRDIGHSTKMENCGKIKVPMLLLPHRAAKWLGEELPYQLDDMAEDAWALLDVLNIPCAHLFGISMGGMIAQRAALQAPERTMSLTSVMSSTNAPDLPQPELWVKLWMLRRPPSNCTVDELLEFRVRSLRHLLRHTLPPDGEYLKKRFLMSLRRSSYAAGLVRQAAAIRRATGRDAELQRLNVPALVVHGAQDVVVPPMNGYRTATMLPYARMLVLKSMGHYFHPAFFPTIIAAFVDMAASTDPAKRYVRSALPSASSRELPPRCGDGGSDESATGKSRASSDMGTGDYGDESSGEPGDNVDPTARMMASLGEYIVPVVADAESPIGKAVCRSVMVAVPGGNNNPAVPEAVIVENLFQRDSHATLSMPKPVVVKRPVLSSLPQSPTQRTASPASTGDGLAISSSQETKREVGPSAPPNIEASPTASAVAVPPSSRSAERYSPPSPPNMEGAAPFVACSPSRWHELEPFPQRSGAATTTAGGADISALGRGEHAFAGKAGAGGAGSSPASSSLDALATETSACSAGSGVGAAVAPSWQRLPRFHPVVAGVTVEEYLRTHPAAQRASGFLPTPAKGGKKAAGSGREGEAAAVDKANFVATPSAAVENATVSPLGPCLAPSLVVSAVAVTEGGVEAVAEAHAEMARVFPASIQWEGRRTDEDFLHSEAPQDVVEASSFAAL